MNNTIAIIPFSNLAFAFIPVVIVVLIMHRWSGSYSGTVIPVLRMLIQLVLIGYVLSYIFALENVMIVLAVLGVMLTASSWIGLLSGHGAKKNRPPASGCRELISGISTYAATQHIF